MNDVDVEHDLSGLGLMVWQPLCDTLIRHSLHFEVNDCCTRYVTISTTKHVANRPCLLLHSGKPKHLKTTTLPETRIEAARII